MVNGGFNIEKVRARKAAIAAERVRLAEEEDELDTALAVFERFSDAGDSAAEVVSSGSPRPEGAPTTWDMVHGLLSHPDHAGGLSGAALVQLLGVTYWPGVHSSQVLPSIYRFLKQGRLAKNEAGLFILPK